MSEAAQETLCSQRSTLNLSSQPTTASGTSEQGWSRADKPKGTASLVQFPSLALPKDDEAIQGISAHLHDPSLCLPKLQRLLGMSRSNLHRKLKAATGMSATEYIRYLRLQQAAWLLIAQPEQSVFCIAIEVGFNDHSYFTKRFREMYGVCPGGFRTRQQNLEHTS